LSISWPTAATPAPSLLALPVGAASLDEADAAIEQWEHYKGRTLDPGQRLDVAVMLATRADGLWAASVTGHEKPRQSGKGDSVEVVEFWGLTQRNERILHTIHDAVLLATETQSRMLSLFDHPDLRRLKAREWKGTGQQMIEMRSGAIIWYRTRTGAGGRGIDEVDRVVVDEAQHAEPEHLRSITPTQAVSANPQLNALGTGGLEGKSSWWWSLRKQAKGAPGAFGYVGYSAQPWTVDDHGRVTLGDVDPTDRDLWWATIPGLVAGRTSIDFLEREYRILGPDGFAQEYLCVWAPPTDGDMATIIPLEQWDALADPASRIAGRAVFALDVSPDRKWATFGVAGRRDDGVIHIEVAERRPGTSWVVPVAVEMFAKNGQPIRVEKGGPAGSLVTQLQEAGVEVEEVSTADHARATGQFIDAALSGGLAHLGGQSLRSAVVAASLRASGDAELWSRRSSKMDITPLVATTLAVGGVPETSDVKQPLYFDVA
jgi:hypothetical protein